MPFLPPNQQHQSTEGSSSRWRKLIKDVWWTGWVWVGECFFWYRPTQLVQDKGPWNSCVCVCVHARARVCVCVCGWLTQVFQRQDVTQRLAKLCKKHGFHSNKYVANCKFCELVFTCHSINETLLLLWTDKIFHSKSEWVSEQLLNGTSLHKTEGAWKSNQPAKIMSEQVLAWLSTWS